MRRAMEFTDNHRAAFASVVTDLTASGRLAGDAIVDRLNSRPASNPSNVIADAHPSLISFGGPR